uniref:Uncharacterized protein n=1 Tax=Anguilla anguilla TaxID=7936 RepID=A0A0E9V663_ANGAN
MFGYAALIYLIIDRFAVGN